MLFNEIYGIYYNTVAAILKEATEKPLSIKDISGIVNKYAFKESNLFITEALSKQKWQLLLKDGCGVVDNIDMPLTTIQKRWLKALELDPRIKLFGDISFNFDVEPLFKPEDIIVFDKYNDGDDFLNEEYIKNFRTILDAIKNKKALKIKSVSRKNRNFDTVLIPGYLEYSEKDDKFRLIGTGSNSKVINLNRIKNCKPYDGEIEIKGNNNPKKDKSRKVTFELVDERNALERVLLHFAHFEKEAIKLDDNNYQVTVIYDKNDETEMIIRILSFGPMIKVISPDNFINLIKQRLNDQKSCEQ